MSKIFRSDVHVGNTTLIRRDPSVLYLQDHVYCPSGTNGCVPGIYDFGRKLVAQSFYSRGPLPADNFPACSMPIAYDSVQDYAEEECYIYLGEVHNHFGHFLLSTLSRLWQIRSLPQNLKIIINAGASIRVELDHVKKLLSAFGVDTKRFWSPEKPVRIKSLILPCPCFEERNFIHSVFKDVFRDAGDKLASKKILKIPSDGPLYLSKSQMTAGVRKIVNEAEIEERLTAEGYAIIYPELLTIGDQIALWRLGRPIVAFNGSALHTCIFSPGSNFISFGWDRYLDSSFPLIDTSNHNKADYFYFEPGSIRELGPSPNHNHGLSGLSSRLEFVHPLAAAESILRAVDLSTAKSRRNLAWNKPSTQSSRYHELDYDVSGLSATSGKLTGRYQFCTCHEGDPWWQVDLGSDCEIEEIVVFNRTDAAADRASILTILLSSDGSTYIPIISRKDEKAFGGLNGEPYRASFIIPKQARFVRLTISGPDFFHLDQVEIFGRELNV